MKKLNSFVIIFLGFIFNWIFADEYPRNLPRQCQYEDNICFKTATENMIRNYPSGYENLNLESIDPLNVIDLEVKNNPLSIINIALKMGNNKYLGLRDLVLSKIRKGFPKDPIGKQVDLTATVPVVSLISDYDLMGQIIILYITGLGRCNLTLVEPKIRLTFDGSLKNISGEDYYKMKNFKIKYKIKKLILDLENLRFNNDLKFGAAMNRFLNQNSEILYNELNPFFTAMFDKQVKKMLQNVFLKVPYNKLFID